MRAELVPRERFELSSGGLGPLALCPFELTEHKEELATSCSLLTGTYVDVNSVFILRL